VRTITVMLGKRPENVPRRQRAKDSRRNRNASRKIDVRVYRVLQQQASVLYHCMLSYTVSALPGKLDGDPD